MDITPLELLLSAISGILVGFMLGLIGGGGSIIAIPLLLYFVGIHNVHYVIGTTALAVGINAYINFLVHRHRTRVNTKAGVLFSIIGVIGVLAGSSLGLFTNSSSLLFLFSFLMMGIGVMMFVGKNGNDSVNQPENVQEKSGRKYRKVGIFSMLTGFASGFFGIGGGFLIVPALMYSAELGIGEAIGTSLFVVGTFGIVTAIRYGMSGDLILSVSLLYVIGGILGGVIGTRISTGMKRSKLRKIFSVVVIMVGIYVLFRTFNFLQFL